MSTIGKCTDCGHPYTTYSWHGGLRLRDAVCPVHGTPLARTTMPQNMRRVVYLTVSPTPRLHALIAGGSRMEVARRHGEADTRTVREVLEGPPAPAPASE
jgi:hypothetical protein